MIVYNTQKITLGDVSFGVQFHSLVTRNQYFHEFCREDDKFDFMEKVSVPSVEIARRMKDFGSESFTEFNLLLEHICNLFLPYDRCLFHGVAICVDDRAWLITAPSGTGKSTQYRLWKELYGDKVRLICGDKPILEFQSFGDIIVHPSPWRGKERWPGSGPARLAGIVYLERGEYNSIRRMSVSEAVVPLYTQILYQPEDETELRQAAAMLDRILRQIPVWKLVNIGDEESARLTYETLCTKKGS